MKGAAEGLRLVICGSNLFSIKGMRGVRKCHLFWSWEREVEVFPLPFVCCSGSSRQSRSVLWAPGCGAAGTVLVTSGFEGRSCERSACPGSRQQPGSGPCRYPLLQHELGIGVKRSLRRDFFPPEQLAIP